jgi:hypothetical protein
LHFKKAGYELQARMFMYALFTEFNKMADANNSLIVPIYSTGFKN